MLDIRPLYNFSIDNLQKWRVQYKKEEYPHKVVTNIMYRAYTTRLVYDCFTNDEMPEFDKYEDASMYAKTFYSVAADIEIKSNLEEWIANEPYEDIGTVCFTTLNDLASDCINGTASKEEIEFEYLLNTLSDIVVLDYIAFRLMGKSSRNAFQIISYFPMEVNEDLDYTQLKRLILQCLVMKFINLNYRPLP
ncbi:hypothetical protein QVN91_01895 [Bacteroides caecigallinarum]|nr:hypothetical protein [Bacteroides caecigallinarum]